MIVSNLRRIMDEKGVTIRELSQRTGLAEETILRARRGGEKGQLGSCMLSTLEAIAKALNVSIKDLFDEQSTGI